MAVVSAAAVRASRTLLQRAETQGLFSKLFGFYVFPSPAVQGMRKSSLPAPAFPVKNILGDRRQCSHKSAFLRGVPDLPLPLHPVQSN
jgi:hypothetical protein